MIFVRAVEDDNRRFRPLEGFQSSLQRLLNTQGSTDELDISIGPLLSNVLKELTGSGFPEFLINPGDLRVFDRLSKSSKIDLFRDFYVNRFAHDYSFDFSLISKHALSRIYEQYVTLLSHEESLQLSLPSMPRLPDSEWNKALGSIYTPQYVARFFARYLQQQMPPITFERLRSIDPACGSGIFLRTLLELQCDPRKVGLTTEAIDQAFSNAHGFDIDSNACQAAKLSISLLHLVLTNRLPQAIAIQNVDAIEYFETHPELANSFDVVIANPPFVSLETQTTEMRRRITEFMSEHALGRTDLYLAFLKIGLDLIKPGGYGLFVLPHSFLIGNSSAGMRREIAETSWVRCLADLSAIRVFEHVGSYVILLVFQKKVTPNEQGSPATVIRCQDFVSIALQNAVESKFSETNYYSVYEVDPSLFTQPTWTTLPPSEVTILETLQRNPPLSDFLFVRQGFVSGADDVFIIPDSVVPSGEEDIYVRFLPDRDMQAYSMPNSFKTHFFYPYIGKAKVTAEILQSRFPQTWEYLLLNRDKLESRAPVKSGHLNWWEPARARRPESMMRPKIVTPHLVIAPRFSLDSTGSVAVSHGPFCYSKDPEIEQDLLRYFLAVMNSTPFYWFAASHSHKYRRGYSMLEPKTLKLTPIPDPSKVEVATFRRILRLVERRILATSDNAIEIEFELDSIVAGLYGLSDADSASLGIETP